MAQELADEVFLRPYLLQAGLTSDEAELLFVAFRRQSKSLSSYLVSLGMIDRATAKMLDAAAKGYVQVNFDKLLGKISLPATLASLAPSTLPESAPLQAQSPSAPDAARDTKKDAPAMSGGSFPASHAEPLLQLGTSSGPAYAPVKIPEPLTPAASTPVVRKPAAPSERSTSAPVVVAEAISSVMKRSSPDLRSSLAMSRKVMRDRILSASLGKLEIGNSGAELRIGRFTLEAKIGESPTAVVFRAFHQTLGVPVAVKLYRTAEQVEGDENQQKFLADARMLARIDHPNIVRVLDVDIFEGLPYIAFEFIVASSLRDLVKTSGRLGAEQVARIGLQVVDALRVASERGVSHRDLRPPNILVRPDLQIKLADFGVPSLLASESRSSASVVVGATQYTAPELSVDPDRADFRADMYSLGATLYYAASGRPPFERSTAMETLQAHLEEFPIALHTVNPTFSLPLSQLILKLLAKKPAERFSSWEELAEALWQILPESQDASFQSSGLAKIPTGSGAAKALSSSGRTGRGAAVLSAKGAGGVAAAGRPQSTGGTMAVLPPSAAESAERSAGSSSGHTALRSEAAGITPQRVKSVMTLLYFTAILCLLLGLLVSILLSSK
jgi:serine/threonine protein kinase